MVLLCCCLAKSDSKDPLLLFYSGSIIILMQLSREVVVFCVERQNLIFKTNGTRGGCYFYPGITFPCETSQMRHLKTIQRSVPDYYSHLKHRLVSRISE